MARAYYKTILRMVRCNILRLVVIALIVAVGIAIVTGVTAIPTQMRLVAEELDNNVLYQAVYNMADKVEIIAFVFPIFFVTVSILCVLVTTTRLIEEERVSIACFRTLGYTIKRIVLRYLIFGFVAVVLGCVLGVVVGNYVVRPIIFESVIHNFGLEVTPGRVLIVDNGIIWSCLMIGFVCIVVVATSMCMLVQTPAVLLRPKSPKAGGRLLIERIKWLWRPLSFRYKSSIRNIWRYKMRTLMIVVSVAGTTIILFAGVGMGVSVSRYSPDVVDIAAFRGSFGIISVVLSVFATVLTVLVLFNLTNVSIEERKREIATLKVLGYTQVETAGFIFREVFVLSILGIVVGLPCGYGLLDFVFGYLDFGSIELVSWWVFVLVAIVALVGVLLTDALLYRKISCINMHSSLKAIE